MNYKLCLAAALMSANSLAAAPTARELNSGWRFRQERLTSWYPATVPGEVHLDLLANNIIGDPFFRLNERGQQWIDKEDWRYETTFGLTPDEQQRKHLRLHFYGLDCYADVYLNGEKILAADNMFREWKVDITGKARRDSNTLLVYFHSPIKTDIPKFDALPFQYRVGPDQSENGGIFDKRISIFARKAGYQYGWDWGPRFVCTGIWRKVTLEAWSDARIEDVYVQQKQVSAKRADLSTQVEIAAESDLPDATLTVRDKASGKVMGQKTVALRKGSNTVAVDFTVKNPKLWWCNGLGEPHRYTFAAELTAAGKLLDTAAATTGLRSLKVALEPDRFGEALYVELNGVRVFAKGANYVPQDNFIPRVTPAQYEQTIAAAADANMNMLRVWGGGTYESDYFYELCDRNGIMVWQDFMFACSLYPSEGAFLENIRQEAIDNVKRLRNHPSIALWCGNNEVYYFWTLWNYDEYYRKQNPEYEKIIWKQYCDLFDGVLPQTVAEYSPGTFYLPSSPYNRNKDEVHNGDRHYWGVWHGNEPTTAFDTVRSRFFSEYGFQSFPEFASVKLFAPDTMDWHITSEVMMAHQRAGSYANPRIADYLRREYRTPKNFEGFLYMSQVLQGDAIKTAIEAHRRDMPYCMGTLFWQHNDCWPVASWASRDYYGRWKAQHYFAREAYRDVLVSPIAKGDTLSVFVVSDRLTPAAGTLSLRVIRLDGATVWEQSKPIAAPANASRSQWAFPIATLLGGAKRNEVLVLAAFTDKAGATYRNRYFLTLQKDVDFPEVHIARSVKPVKGGYEVALSADKFARAVYLSLDGVDNFFGNNFFDILPGETVRVKVTTTLPPDDFERQLRVQSLRDAYSEDALEARVEALLRRMTLEEKVEQMENRGAGKTEEIEKIFGGRSYGTTHEMGMSAQACADMYRALQTYMRTKTRLGIPLLTCAEGIEGVLQNGCTIFPHALAQGSTFNPELLRRMTEAAGDEARAIGIRQVLSPVFDIARELRWGRIEETYGEDPFLIAAMGTAFVQGYMSRGVNCMPKHFVAHGTPTGGLNAASVSGGERELYNLYLYPFRKVIADAHPLAVMSAYHAYDGVATTGSPYLMTDVLRNHLGFDGYVYSDWGSVERLKTFHHAAATDGEAAQMAVEAGVDVNVGWSYRLLPERVKAGLMDEKYIDRAVRRILTVKFKLGLFDNPYGEPERVKDVVHSADKVALAKAVADESAVLLKNEGRLLPLDLNKYRRIAIVGPNSDQMVAGDYSWVSTFTSEGIGLLQGMKNATQGHGVSLLHAKGCDWWSRDSSGLAEAVALVRSCDVAVVAVGTRSAYLGRSPQKSTAGEGFDLSSLDLPGCQQQLLQAVKATGKPLVVALIAGKPLAIPWVKDNADAVLVQWYAGEQQGNALADIIVGKVNPSGRLNVSFPRSTGNTPCFYNYYPGDREYESDRGGTYDEPRGHYVFERPYALWDFGYGLSYTTFGYTACTFSDSVFSREADTLTVTVTLKNTGARDGKEVVQLYVRDLVSSVATPVQQLKAFRKTSVKAGAEAQVTLKLPMSELALYNARLQRVVEPGEFEVQVGASSGDIRFKKTIRYGLIPTG